VTYSSVTFRPLPRTSSHNHSLACLVGNHLYISAIPDDSPSYIMATITFREYGFKKPNVIFEQRIRPNSF
jgi:hypothetical protein